LLLVLLLVKLLLLPFFGKAALLLLEPQLLRKLPLVPLPLLQALLEVLFISIL
jgi:hypothetical protein